MPKGSDDRNYLRVFRNSFFRGLAMAVKNFSGNIFNYRGNGVIVPL